MKDVTQIPDKVVPVSFYSGCSAGGSASGLGPEGRRFESCHPDIVENIPSSLYLVERVTGYMWVRVPFLRPCAFSSAVRAGDS